MDIQKRRTFIISFIYFGIIGVLCYIGLKKLLPILIPFMAAMAIAALLEPAVSLLDRHMKGGKGVAAGSSKAAIAMAAMKGISMGRSFFNPI